MRYYVYFIQAGDVGGPIKIGRAYDIQKRMNTLQTANSEDLTLLGDIHCENKHAAVALESRLLEELQDSHIRGEWFRATGQVLAIVPPEGCDAGATCRRQITSDDVEKRPAQWWDGLAPFRIKRTEYHAPNLDGDYPPWADEIDRKNLDALPTGERHFMMETMRRRFA